MKEVLREAVERFSEHVAGFCVGDVWDSETAHLWEAVEDALYPERSEAP